MPERPAHAPAGSSNRVTATALLRYVVITPAHNEESHLARLAEAMIAQTHRPEQWVIVDDRSTDATRVIADAYAGAHDWITVVATPRDGAHTDGDRYYAPVVRAFNTGLAAVQPADIVVKLDADLYLPPHYFEWVARTFAAAPRAGIVGGTIMEHDGRAWRTDVVNPHHVRGAFKAYRWECLEEIGGLHAGRGWDGIDGHAARGRGWELYVLSELPVLHYRRRGGTHGWRRARWEEGRSAHHMGYRAPYLLLRAAYRAIRERPRLLGGMALAGGYFSAMARREAIVDDPIAVDAVRAHQSEVLRHLFRRAPSPRVPALPGGGPAAWTGMNDAPGAAETPQAEGDGAS